MRFVLITDAYPPSRTSGAVQVRDLSVELVRQGHSVTVLVASPELSHSWAGEVWNGVSVVRLRTFRTKDVSYIRRSVGELLMPFLMLITLRSSPYWLEKFDGVLWYSPTIFLGPIARKLKSRSNCRGYLILRDIFPEWAVDMKLMGKGLAYRVFKLVANYQYRVADVIGVQTPGNLSYFDEWRGHPEKRLEVLQNWLAPAGDRGCSISIRDTSLAGRKIFVYAGNMGVAQGVGVVLELAESLRSRRDIGFVLVGRGSDVARLRQDAIRRKLDNLLFFDEIAPEEIPGLYSQCHLGIVALDSRHTTHNIPGKFLTYMQSGLPVFAIVNAGNDLIGLIQRERVGVAMVHSSAEDLMINATQALSAIDADAEIEDRCRCLSSRMFSAETAARQIVAALRP